MDEDSKTVLEIDKPEQQNFTKYYSSLPTKTESTIRLFERDSASKRYYTFHGEDATYIAQNVYKSTSVIKYWGGDVNTGLASCWLSSSACEAFLRDALLQKHLRIEIWQKRNNEWKIAKRASPGNLQDVEDLLFAGSQSMSAAPVVMAVKLGTSADHKIIGVGFADASMRELGVAEFVDNEIYSNFESLIIQLGVKECIVSLEKIKDYELSKVKGVLDRVGVVMTERNKADFTTKDIEQDLNRLLGDEISIASLPEFEMKTAMAATACLIKYLELLSDESNFGHYRLKHHDLSQYMKLDASALRALNLTPGPNDGSNKTMSLFGLLNKCKTSQGTRLLGQWLKQPLMNIEEIEIRQNLVEAFVEDTELRQTMQENHLKNIPDLHRLAKRFQKAIATLQDVVRVYQVIIRLPSLLACLEMYDANQAYKNLMEEIYISKLREYSMNLEKLQELVETTIDLEAVEDHEFLIKADFDDTLKELKEKIDEIKGQIDDEHQRIGNLIGLDIEKKLKMEKHTTYGYCLRVNRNDASLISGKKGFIEYATQKAGTYFTTSKLKDLSQNISDLSDQYNRKQSDLVKEVINIVASYCPILEMLGGLVAHMDVLISFAHIAVNAPQPYVRPKITKKGEGNLILKQSRHPCLEVQDDVSFIPNDVALARNKSEFQIVTGPNMGGKSTYIRQIGVIALMAQTGCFVPCTEAEVCVFDCILARVGAGDSQLKGVSTFMAEMLETATILKSATVNSLIIIDELGRGTSTYDGFGLAWSISEHIATEIGCFSLFATHFHELTALGEKVPHVKNLHVSVHVGQGKSGNGCEITLLYKVNEGVCDQSFGIHVAKLANFPETVVSLAKRKVNELEGNFEDDTLPSKCSKTEIEEGNVIIEECLQELADNVDIEEVDHQILLEHLRSVRLKYEERAMGNAYIQEVLAEL